MFGLDDWIAAFSDSGKLALVAVVAIVLGSGLRRNPSMTSKRYRSFDSRSRRVALPTVD